MTRKPHRLEPAERNRSSLVLLLLVFWLVACSEPLPEASLSTVLPSPVTPGAIVTAYGDLPESAVLHLGDDLVVATPVSSGLQFTVPEWTVAGVHTLSVKVGAQTLKGVVQVIPRIDEVGLKRQTLTLNGAGWPTEAVNETPVRIELSGLSLTPTLAPGQLLADVPDTLSYGPLTVQVSVGEQRSERTSLSRAAGAVKGSVVLPGSSPQASLSKPALRLSGVGTTATNSLIVFHDAGRLNLIQTFFPNAKRKHLPTLSATQLSFASTIEAQAAYEKLETLPGVSVEWDAPVHTDGFDALYLNTQGEVQGKQWFLPLIGSEAAWKRTRGEGVVVAVVDTGVQLDHPDLSENLLPGYDFVDVDSDPYDLAGHGTHVAGLVAANGQVSGTAPDAKVLPVRVLEGTSGGSSFTVAQGILWAADLLGEPTNPNPAQVINLSLGSSGYTEAIARAVERVQEAGVIVVAATGNSGGPVAYPAALPGVISVTSLAGPNLAYQPWYANKGLGTLLTAYGGDTTQDQDDDGVQDGILSTDLDGYSLRMGTSMASPQVAGLAALALAAGTSPSLVADTLVGTTTELGVMGYDSSFGHGLATGRSASTSDPKLYLLALSEEGELLTWTLVQEDLSYTLNNLPPSAPIYLRAVSDEDNDGILAEAGELASPLLALTPEEAEVAFIEPLELTVSSGARQHRLEARH